MWKFVKKHRYDFCKNRFDNKAIDQFSAIPFWVFIDLKALHIKFDQIIKWHEFIDSILKSLFCFLNYN